MLIKNARHAAALALVLFASATRVVTYTITGGV